MALRQGNRVPPARPDRVRRRARSAGHRGSGHPVRQGSRRRRGVRDVDDLFTLSAEQLAEASGSAKRGDKLAAQIQQAKSLPLGRILCAPGIVGTGRSMYRRIAARFGSMEAIRRADAAALREVDGIGAEKAPVIVQQLADQAQVIDRLVAAGVTMAPSEVSGTAQGPLNGKVVVVTGRMTGRLDGVGRSDMTTLIQKAGGRAGSSVSASTDYLVAAAGAGGKPSTKAARAQQLGVQVLSPDEFADMVTDYIS
ncbi:helix-hairpin-helix domain-containing protein [Streptomyces sp. NPDC091416]|uniref:helix-hairpin-helix domain-containing protein n=1 Tax=Streptomyces sp. NPDC091416 TaxID=3366003 RepID=UPI00382F74AB